MIKNFLLVFIPIFVAVDSVGILPVFVSLTQGLHKNEKLKIIFQSMITAGCLAIGFIFLGKTVFKLLGITICDFMVAGGAILFCISIVDIMVPGKSKRIPNRELGAVPLGTPLIVGPAVLTTSLIMLGEHGLYLTLAAVITNIFLTGIILSLSNILVKILGESGVKALSKIAHLFLAAIAVMMIRKGIVLVISLASK
ncbi:MarC family protein [Candidatus Desantisbacteria bacterium]|nr:MarC family protein [Candidatus Desantisbacteria bacterium]